MLHDISKWEKGGINLIPSSLGPSFQVVHRAPLMPPRKPAVPPPLLRRPTHTRTNPSSLKRKLSSMIYQRTYTLERSDVSPRCDIHVILCVRCQKGLLCYVCVFATYCANWPSFEGPVKFATTGYQNWKNGRKSSWSEKCQACQCHICGSPFDRKRLEVIQTPERCE